MIRLLIADDEKIMRESLSTIIDWESLGIEVVAVCKDGLEAYDAILDEYPDIVLTDIKMPKLSGLELIHKITQNHDNIQFIILSGYDEFSYAKEAMRYGIKHYILKPCNEAEIIHAVQDLITEHHKQRGMTDRSNALELQENIMHHIFLQALSAKHNFTELSKIYSSFLDVTTVPYTLCYIYFIEENLVHTCIESIQKFINTENLPYNFTYIYVKNTLLFFTANQTEDLAHIDTLLQSTCIKTDSNLCSYHRETFCNLHTLMDVLVQKTKRYETIYLYTCKQKTSICNYASLFDQIAELSEKLTTVSNKNDYDKTLQELLTLIAPIRNTDLLHALANNILLKILTNIDSYSSSEISDFILLLSNLHSGDEICQFLNNTLNTVFAPQIGSPEKYKPFIQEILDYTSEHISDPNLTLKWIVENHLFMNVNYVSRQFMIQTGTKFSSYLNELRIQKAKQLLINCDSEKIYTVAEQVGCGNNPQYFSHLFKKYTQMTPKEYMQKMTGKTFF